MGLSAPRLLHVISRDDSMTDPKNPNLSIPPWPDLQEGYLDEFGFVDPEVHKLAGMLWPSFQPRILRAINDLDSGQRLMMKAVTIVSRRRQEQPEQMTNLRGYLSVIFAHLLMAASRRQAGLDQLDDENTDLPGTTNDGSGTQIELSILADEILHRADEWTKQVYEHLVLGYTFEEVAQKFQMKANHLRAKWWKNISRLKKQIGKETKAARQKILQERNRGL
jgi:hypothetical protein